jgi:glycosyltransferase involved in cell wall biosynthesis
VPRPHVTAVVISFNEEAKIGRCLDSMRGVVDDVFVLDSGSTDRTAEICRERGARMLVEPFRGYGAQKNAAVAHVAAEWILSLDADEELSPELAASMVEALRDPRADAFEVNRLSRYCGRWIRRSGWYPDRKVRLFRRTAGRFVAVEPHDRFAPDPGARVERLRGDLLHHYVATPEQHAAKVRRFAEIAARTMFAEGRRASWPKIVVKTANGFVRAYLWHLGFLEGREGYLIARNAAIEKFLKYRGLRRLVLAARGESGAAGT